MKFVKNVQYLIAGFTIIAQLFTKNSLSSARKKPVMSVIFFIFTFTNTA